jgi:hypothetical protein
VNPEDASEELLPGQFWYNFLNGFHKKLIVDLAGSENERQNPVLFDGN